MSQYWSLTHLTPLNHRRKNFLGPTIRSISTAIQHAFKKTMINVTCIVAEDLISTMQGKGKRRIHPADWWLVGLEAGSKCHFSSPKKCQAGLVHGQPFPWPMREHRLGSRPDNEGFKKPGEDWIYLDSNLLIYAMQLYSWLITVIRWDWSFKTCSYN